MSRATVATIHLGALRRNLARVCEMAGNARVMAVVKADGYGHGLERVAQALRGADAFGVAALGDGLRLRAAGIDTRIVVLSGPDEASDLTELRRQRLDAVVHHEQQLRWLEADRDPRRLRVWLKIDTGMHRLGLAPDEAAPAFARLRALPNIDGEITLMTHFAASDEFDRPLTAEQIACFDAATLDLPGERSLANSAGLLGWPQARGTGSSADAQRVVAPPAGARNADARRYWGRVGGLLYGLSVIDGRSGSDLGFEPAMTLATKLISIKRVHKGEAIGYAATWRCPEDMPIGVAAIGYGDGYPRSIRPGTPVLVGGVRAPIVGRVSMDLVTIDLRGVPDAQVGDGVVLWGRELPVEEIAAHAGTIGYDLTCGMTRRVLFVEDAG
jgi:alanine racemase